MKSWDQDMGRAIMAGLTLIYSKDGWLSTLFSTYMYAVLGRPLCCCLMATAHIINQWQYDLPRSMKLLLCLPPHTTHESQPLDCGVFGPLWFNFNQVFSEACLKSVVPVNIVAGFWKCGVHPYNPAAISVPGRGYSTKGGESADGSGASSDNEDGSVSPGDQSEGVLPSCHVSGASIDEVTSRSGSDGASFWDGDSQN